MTRRTPPSQSRPSRTASEPQAESDADSAGQRRRATASGTARSTRPGTVTVPAVTSTGSGSLGL